MHFLTFRHDFRIDRKEVEDVPELQIGLLIVFSIVLVIASWAMIEDIFTEP